MRILVVEDEAILGQQLKEKLQQEKYAVDLAKDGEEGLFLGREYPFDLAIIDIGLPKISGIALIQKLRKEGKSFPIVILTARGRWEEKVEGLEAGADDYLVKPFHMEELLARMRVQLRRSGGWTQSLLAFGSLTLDTHRQEVKVEGHAIELTTFEYKLMEYLALHAGKVISKTELTEHIYDQDFDLDSNVIEVFIGRLRKKLDPDGHLKPIETLRGRGYRLALAPESSIESAIAE